MKKLSAYLFLLLFTLQTSSWADDIRDFQIEGMSIGDSALDYFSEDEIENKKKKGFVYPNKEFYSATFRYKPQFKLYDGVQFHLKAKDKRYIIYSIGGKIYYPNNINKCHMQMDEIVSEIKTLFKDAKIQNDGTNKHDDGSNTMVRSIFIVLKSGDEIAVECYDWDEEKNIKDNLTIAIDKKEFAYWLHNIAWN